MQNDSGNGLTLGRVDWTSVLVYVLLVLMGWLNIYAAVYDESHASIFDLTQRYGMQLVWIASSQIMEDAYNSYSSDANEDFVLNVLEMMCEKDDSISVRSKSLTNEYLTISTGDSSMIKVVTMGIIPAVYLIAGIIVVGGNRDETSEKIAYTFRNPGGMCRRNGGCLPGEL